MDKLERIHLLRAIHKKQGEMMEQLQALETAVTQLIQVNTDLVAVIARAIGSVGNGETVPPQAIESVTDKINNVVVELQKAGKELQDAVEKPASSEAPADSNPPETQSGP